MLRNGINGEVEHVSSKGAHALRWVVNHKIHNVPPSTDKVTYGCIVEVLKYTATETGRIKNYIIVGRTDERLLTKANVQFPIGTAPARVESPVGKALYDSEVGGKVDVYVSDTTKFYLEVKSIEIINYLRE